MKKHHSKPNGLRGSFLAFLIVALLFLAMGLGTLGSFRGTGEAFVLTSNSSEGLDTSGVVFKLSGLTEKDGSTTSLQLRSVWLNLGAVYAEAGTPAEVRVDRGTSAESFTTGYNGVVENFYTAADAKTQPTATDAFFNYSAPFNKLPEVGWRVSTYPYVRISLKQATPNILLNEVVFVGEKLNSSYEGTGEMVVIPATVYAATPSSNESAAEALARAQALLDAQHMPPAAETTFERFSKDEVYTMMTISEMRLGNVYSADMAGLPVDTYTVDGVYGAFGLDILALGTMMFGMSPFGLRFFPMLAAFGALVLLARFVVKLTHSEKAGLVFTVLYALSALTLGYGHYGTPLFLGIFFFACALMLVYRFYANGMKRASFLSALPLLAGGLFGAAAISVNGAFLIPVLGLIGLFVAGMVRQQKAKRYYLEKALAEPEEPLYAAETEGTEQPAEPATPAQRAAKVLSEYRFKNSAAPILFGISLVFGVFLFALCGMIPAYFTFLKAYDNPAAPATNVFRLAWQTFANGFAGVNAYGAGSGWHPYNVLYAGTGAMHAVTALAVNPIVLLAALGGAVFAVVRLVLLLKDKERGKAWRAEMRRIVILLAGLALSLVATAVKTAAPFVVLVYLFGMMLAAACFSAQPEEKAHAAVRIAEIVGLVLLAVAFAVLAAPIFSIPLPAGFLGLI